MDLLSGYKSSDSEGESNGAAIANKAATSITKNDVVPPGPKMADRRVLQAAPTPSILAMVKANHALDIHHTKSQPNGATSRSNGSTSGEMMLMNNPLKSQLMQPVQGPAILDPNGIDSTKKKHGDESHIKANVAFDHTSFEEQRNAFQRSGRALAPDERGTSIDRGTFGHTRRRRNKETNRFELISEEQYQAEDRAKRKE